MVQKPTGEKEGEQRSKEKEKRWPEGGVGIKKHDNPTEGNHVILMGPPKNDTQFLGQTPESQSKKGKDFVAMKDVLQGSAAAKVVSEDGRRGRFNLGKPFLILSIIFIIVFVIGDIANIFGPIDIHFVRLLPLLLVLLAISFIDVKRTPRSQTAGVVVTALIFLVAIGGLIRFWNVVSIVPTGTRIEEERIMPEFSNIVFDGVGDVVIVSAQQHNVTVEGDEAIVANVATDVRNGTLFISYKSPFLKLFLSDESYVTVSLIAPSIDSVTLTGRGTISGDIGTADTLALGLHGEGDISLLGIDTDAVTSHLLGEGTITLSGKTVRHLVYVSGSGTYNAENLLSDETGVRLTGSGDVTVHAGKELNVVISGDGTVFYVGTPTITDNTVTGTGSITPHK